MGQEDKETGRIGLSRRDFLKVSAAGAVAATALDWAPAPAMAEMPYHTVAGGYSHTDTAILRYHTTCPYCSASCGQLVAVGNNTGDVYDIYGDVNSPINNGGLCAKGAGAYQLVNNVRRIGVPEHTTGAVNGDGKDMTGTAWVRTGNAAWTEIPLATAMTEIAGGHTGDGRTHSGLVGYRNANGETPAAGNYYNSDGVMFFGSSHMNNEQNYLYRKLVATFGTSNVEHQARI
jgi:formate dehydrogenase major subunit